MESLEDVRKKYFTSPFCNTFTEYKGCVLGPEFRKMEEKISNMEVRENDIWLMSFPKSGTTWLQETLWMIMNNLDFEESRKTDLCDRSPYLELSSLFTFDTIEKENPGFFQKIPELTRDSFGFSQRKMTCETPLIIKTHLPWGLLPKEIQDGTKKPKIVYITRNPKDVCISYFYHSQRFFGYSGDFEAFCELFLAGKLYYSPFWSHVLPFYNQNSSHLMFITYEEMVKDLPSIIRRLAAFLGKPLNEKQIENLVEYLSFENMKKNSAVNNSNAGLWMKPFHDTQHQDFMRSGKSGEFKNKMSPDIIRKFDEWIMENTVGTELLYRI